MDINELLNTLHINDTEYLIIGVSSGPDSMCLLDILRKKYKNIVCTHINHNVRKESKEEELYLNNFCKENNIFFESMTIKEYKENNFENEARNIRYSFYEEIMDKYNSKYLFLAHHGDDLIETILMKLVRGSNIEGYAGIKEISKVKNYYIIRPLLKYTKEDIIKYNQDNNIKYYIDKTNNDISYTRNRYRKNILPLLKEENKNVNKNFLDYSKTLIEYDNYIKEVVNEKIEVLFSNNKLNTKLFLKESILIQKNIIYCILKAIYNNENNIIKERHIISIVNLINNNRPNSYLNLPRNIRVIKEYDYIIFNSNSNFQSYKYELKDYNIINNHMINSVKECNTDGNDVCRLNSKELSLPLYIRNKERKDSIIVKGLGHKKVKDIFIDKKIPKIERDSYPLLVDSNNNVLWIPNIKKSQFNKKKEDFYDIILKYCQKEEE